MDEGSKSGRAEASPEPKRGINWWRIALLVALMIALWVFGKQSGLIEHFHVERVRSTVRDAGVLGVVLYVAIFAAGELVHIPGIVFVAAGLLAWGKLIGYPIALFSSVVSVGISFLVVRTVGGRALAGLDRPFFKRILDHLDDRPIRTVFLLRILLFLAPPLNYGLAMTNVRFRDYLVGSALGLVLPLLVVTLLFDWVLSLIS